MSDNFAYRPGLNSVGNYQVSGIPFVTGGITIPANTSPALELNFPSITQRIHIHNNDTTNGLRIGFSAAGVSGSNFWLVEPHTSSGKNNDYIELRIKCNKLFLRSNTASAITGAYIAAELSGITNNSVGFDLAASYSGSSGIG